MVCRKGHQGELPQVQALGEAEAWQAAPRGYEQEPQHKAQDGAWRRALGEGLRGLRRRYEGRDHGGNRRSFGRWDKRVLGRWLRGEVSRDRNTRPEAERGGGF